jgi:phosphoribosylanthranilate isomerase
MEAGVPCRVKICGLRRREDVAAAGEAGADAVGLVFAAGPRRLEVSTAAELSREAPPGVVVVGVFRDPDAASVLRAVEEAGLDAVQIHGAVPDDLALPAGVELIRAFHATGPEVLDELARHFASAGAAPVLLDSARGGGSGARADWDLAARAARLGPLWLAGGLDPACVGEAIRRVRPFGVDVSGGVERRPGEKDPDLIKRFVAEVRGVEDP